MGETGTTIKGGAYTLMDSKNYALFQNIGKDFPSGGMQSYTVRGGESLQNIADSMYGNASLWYMIADANGLSGNETLKAGQVLRVPSANQTGTLDSSAHKVYNESEIVGSKLPNLKAPPPKKGGCGSFLQVLVIIVAIVASCVLGPQMLLLANAALGAGVAATVAAAALTGAAVSVVTQVVSIAVGLQDSFSWKAVAKGALAGAITAGVGALSSGINTGSAAVNAGIRGAISNVATQGVSMMMGDQKKFSWRSVASAGVGAAAGQAVGGLLQDSTDLKPSDMAYKQITSATSSVASQLVSNGKVDWRSVAVNAVMMPLGEMAGRMGPGMGQALAQGAVGALTAKLKKQDAWAGGLGAMAGNITGQLASQMLPMGAAGGFSELPDPKAVNSWGGFFDSFGGDNYKPMFTVADTMGMMVGQLGSSVGKAVAQLTNRDQGVAAQAASGAASESFNSGVKAERAKIFQDGEDAKAAAKQSAATNKTAGIAARQNLFGSETSGFTKGITQNYLSEDDRLALDTPFANMALEGLRDTNGSAGADAGERSLAPVARRNGPVDPDAPVNYGTQIRDLGLYATVNIVGHRWDETQSLSAKAALQPLKAEGDKLGYAGGVYTVDPETGVRTLDTRAEIGSLDAKGRNMLDRRLSYLNGMADPNSTLDQIGSFFTGKLDHAATTLSADDIEERNSLNAMSRGFAVDDLSRVLGAVPGKPESGNAPDYRITTGAGVSPSSVRHTGLLSYINNGMKRVLGENTANSVVRYAADGFRTGVQFAGDVNDVKEAMKIKLTLSAINTTVNALNKLGTNIDLTNENKRWTMRADKLLEKEGGAFKKQIVGVGGIVSGVTKAVGNIAADLVTIGYTVGASSLYQRLDNVGLGDYAPEFAKNAHYTLGETTDKLFKASDKAFTALTTDFSGTMAGVGTWGANATEKYFGEIKTAMTVGGVAGYKAGEAVGEKTFNIVTTAMGLPGAVRGTISAATKAGNLIGRAGELKIFGGAGVQGAAVGSAGAVAAAEIGSSAAQIGRTAEHVADSVGDAAAASRKADKALTTAAKDQPSIVQRGETPKIEAGNVGKSGNSFEPARTGHPDNPVGLRNADELVGRPPSVDAGATRGATSASPNGVVADSVGARVPDQIHAPAMEKPNVSAPVRNSPDPISTSPTRELSTPTTVGGCFVAGTLVWTDGGRLPIEQVRIGDMVWSQPELTGDRSYRRVLDTFIYTEKSVYRVSYEDAAGVPDSVIATPNHPFFVLGIGWIAAENLSAGTILELHDGTNATVTDIVDTGEIATVYNFEVDGFHTYYVGDLGTWVHNVNCKTAAEIAAIQRMAEKGRVASPAADMRRAYVQAKAELLKSEVSALNNIGSKNRVAAPVKELSPPQFGRSGVLDVDINARGLVNNALQSKFDDLANQGHAVGRHGPRVSEEKLVARAMYKKDPMTGTTTDFYKAPALHSAGRTASKFTSKEGMVKAHDVVVKSPEYAVNKADAVANVESRFSVELPLEDVFGPHYLGSVTGKTRIGSTANPTGVSPTNFTGGNVLAVFKVDSAGQWNLLTMYPNPI
ncbi:MAG TPA: polymorphic toxin-type HINT domain-containing protein [Telluria sp.]